MYPYRSDKKQIFCAESKAEMVDREILMERLRRFFHENESEGDLSLRVFTAQGALPVKSAKIRITKELGDGYGFLLTAETDESGSKAGIRLPAPSREKALSRLSDVPQPYALYDVQVSAPEYVTKTLTDVAIVEGITSLQPVEMQPVLFRSSEG